MLTKVEQVKRVRLESVESQPESCGEGRVHVAHQMLHLCPLEVTWVTCHLLEVSQRQFGF